MKKRIYATFLLLGATSFNLSAETLNSSAQSELLLMIQQLQNEVRQLRGEAETQSYKLQKMEREQLERYRDMDKRLSALILNQADQPTAQVEPVAPVETAPAQQLAEPVEQVGTPASTEQPAVQAPTKVSDSKAYQDAFALVRERRFDEALAEFDAFIETYPDSDNLANAYYWIGEVKLAQQKLPPAKEAFETVVERFLTHRKRPDALYKLGVVKDRMGDVAGKSAIFESLLSEYPTSSAAGLARNYQTR